MRRMVRLLGVLACVGVVGQAYWLHAQTGGRAWTAFPDATLAGMKSHQGEVEEVMGGAGAAPIDNDFHLGWLPSGAGREMLSVATLAMPMLLALLAIAFPVRRRGGH